MSFLQKISQWMGSAAVLEAEAHIFQAGFAALGALHFWPAAKAEVVAAVFCFALTKEFLIDHLRHPDESVWIAFRDFSYFMLGAAAAFAVVSL